MTEISLSPEAQEMLPKAVNEVLKLYVGDQLANQLRTQPPEYRDKLWNETAEEYGPFSEKIKGLREVLKTADITRRGYPEPVARVMEMNFLAVEDVISRQLLTDILFARTASSPGYLDYQMQPADEAEHMMNSLWKDVMSTSREDSMKSVDLNQVVESVLTGGLKLSRQTQLQEK